MTELYSINGSSESSDSISLSRKEAESYEKYDTWARGGPDMFTELGMFMGNSTLNVSNRISGQLGAMRVRSSVEAIRNAVPRIVSYYSDVLFTGDLEDALELKFGQDGENESSEKLKAAIHEVWEFSNLTQSRRVLVRYLALYGSVFIKVVRPESKDYCYLQWLKPQYITAFDEDDRGNLTYVRLDIPDTEDTGTPQERPVWRSESWSKEKQEAVFATIERRSDDTVASEQALRDADGAKVLSFEELHGADFLPFAAIRAADTGEKRPAPVYDNALHLMAWINREATRLSDLLFRHNKAHKAIVGIGNDASGRPMAPPRPDGVRDLGQMNAEQEAQYTQPFGGSRGTILSSQNDDISIDGVAVMGLPGNAQMVDISPNINYEAARQWISDHIRELYEECPELLYYAVENRANQSGYALRQLIAGAVSRAEEMRDSILAALLKADMMALTVAQQAGLEGFSSSEIGTYENGDFAHSFEPPEILPQTEAERREAEAAKTENAQSLMGVLTQLGVPREKQREVVLKELGLEELASETANVGEPETGEPPEVAEGDGSDRNAARLALERRLNGGT